MMNVLLYFVLFIINVQINASDCIQNTKVILDIPSERESFTDDVKLFKRVKDLLFNEDSSVKEKWLGIEGYYRFSEEHFDGNMRKAYETVSSILGGGNSILMQQLSWQKFLGDTKEFKLIRELILNKDNSIKEELVGMEGYYHLAEKQFNGDMRRTYNSVSAILGGSKSKLMQQLGWQQLLGNTQDFKLVIEFLFDEEDIIKKEFFGMEGYYRFAEEYFNGDMYKTYKTVSAVLGGGKNRLMQQLNWQQFPSNTAEFKRLRDLIVNKDNSIKKEFCGMEGYYRFAEIHFDRDMRKTYQSISAVLGGSTSELMQQLDWRHFSGNTTEFKRIRDLIFNEDSSIKEEFLGMEGYLRFADKYFNGSTHRAYNTISSSLGGSSSRFMQQQLGWRYFSGNTTKFRQLRNWIVNEDNNIREEFLGIEGYYHFAAKYFNGNLSQAYSRVSLVLGGPNSKAMQQLGWQELPDNTKGSGSLKDFIINEDGSIKEEFIGMTGYYRFADEYFNGNMLQAYKSVSSAVKGDKNKYMQQLGWLKFSGSTDEFKRLRDPIINNKDNSIKEEFVGMEGYLRFADEYFNGDMRITYQKISSLLGRADSEAMTELGWHQFPGKTKEFKRLRDLVVNEDSSIKEEFVGMAGYYHFAEEYFDGNIDKAYEMVSSVWGGANSKVMQQLRWQRFAGDQAEYNRLRSLILHPEGYLRIEYMGLDGQELFADEYFDGDMIRAYNKIYNVLGGDLGHYMKLLIWAKKR